MKISRPKGKNLKMAHLPRPACIIKSAVTLYCQSKARHSIAGHSWTLLASWVKEPGSGCDRKEASLCFFSRKPSEIPLAFSSEHWAFTRFFSASRQKDTQQSVVRLRLPTASYVTELEFNFTWARVSHVLNNAINTCTIPMTELNNVCKV